MGVRLSKGTRRRATRRRGAPALEATGRPGPGADRIRARGARSRTRADLIKVVGEALKTNLTTLGPLVLPYSEQAKFLLNYFQVRRGGWARAPGAGVRSLYARTGGPRCARTASSARS